ncbi:MAG: tripartite tricarboxylate transporter substrate-binding protein [Burkholderiales bacterium]
MRLIAAWWLLVLSAWSHAAYPERAVELILPFPATGSTDISGIPRISKLVRVMQNMSAPSLTDNMVQQLQQTLAGALGQPVNVLRRVRGKTNAGSRYVAQSAADGYTLLFADNPTITVFPALNPSPSFDIRTDLVPVAMFARMPIALITVADRPHESLRDLIERARRFPASVNYASAGDGSTSHLTGELFAMTAHVQIVHVNYNGSLPAMNAVLTGQVELGFVPLPAVLPYLNGGKIRIIAMASAMRHPTVADVATIGESGVAGFEASGWFGIFAPARTPSAIVSLLNYDVNRALSEDLVQRALLAQGMLPAPGTSEEFRLQVENDRERWARVLRTAAFRR